MAKKPTAASTTVHRLKVTLLETEPPVWRRVEVASEMTLDELHVVLQLAMGWTDSHLHQFEQGDACYGVPDPMGFQEVLDERRARVGELLKRRGARMRYEYDFGDSWEHELVVQEVAPRAV